MMGHLDGLAALPYASQGARVNQGSHIPNERCKRGFASKRQLPTAKHLGEVLSEFLHSYLYFCRTILEANN